MTFEGSETGENSIPKIRERVGYEKIYSQISGTGRKRKKAFLKFGNKKGMKKKNIPKIRELESEASIPGNGREQEWEREREWNEKITMIRTE